MPESGEGVVGPTDATAVIPEVKEAVPFDWHTEIDPSVKDDPVWKSTPDLKTLTKAYVDGVHYNVGAIKMPGKDATPEDWQAFHTKIGRPSTPEDYPLSEAIKDDPTATNMRNVAHSAGLRSEQWEKLMTGWARIKMDESKQQAAARDVTMGELQEQYGAAYERKMALVQRLVKSHGGEETFTSLAASPLGNHKGLLTMLASIAEAMVEEDLLVGTSDGVFSKEDVTNELSTLTASPAYLNPHSPGHAVAVKRATQLFETLYN